jgi:hypothetical protein
MVESGVGEHRNRCRPSDVANLSRSPDKLLAQLCPVLDT